MDEVELPPLPPSFQASPRRSSTYSLLSRKRSRTDYEIEPATSSDPALFSSDETAPSAENYSAKRRKDKWSGTWWGERLRGKSAREKRQFKRNYDSGIWMGSEGTDSSLDEDFLNDQRKFDANQKPVPDDHQTSNGENHGSITAKLDEDVQTDFGEEDGIRSSKPACESLCVTNARALIQECVDRGHEDINLT